MKVLSTGGNPRNRKTVQSIASLVLLTLASACGDSQTIVLDGAGSDDSEGGNAGAGGSATEDSTDLSPVYAVASSVRAPTPTTYVIMSDSLSGSLDAEDAILELPGSAMVVGPVSGERLYVGTAASGELVRYDLSDDGKTLEESGSINLQAAGVSSLRTYSSAFQFIDEHKAYFFTPEKIILWDPEDMVLLPDSIELDGVVRENPDTPDQPYTASFTGSPVRDGDMLYYFTAWDSRAAGVIEIVPASTVVAINTATDTADVYVDERCGYARDGVVDGDYIYIASEAVAGGVNFLNSDNGGEPCMIRFNKETQEIDSDYLVNLNDLANGAPVGSLVTAPSGEAFIYVLDAEVAEEELVDNPMLSNPRFLSIGSLWKTAALTVGDDPQLDILDNPLTSGAVLAHELRDGLKVTATFDPAGMELREVTDEGVVPTDQANATLVGNTSTLVQLR